MNALQLRIWSDAWYLLLENNDNLGNENIFCITGNDTYVAEIRRLHWVIVDAYRTRYAMLQTPLLFMFLCLKFLCIIQIQKILQIPRIHFPRLKFRSGPNGRQNNRKYIACFVYIARATADSPHQELLVSINLPWPCSRSMLLPTIFQQLAF